MNVGGITSSNWHCWYLKLLLSLLLLNSHRNYFQRKFVRECADAANDTFKKFRDWIDKTYPLGCLNDDDWEIIMRNDEDQYYREVIEEHYDLGTCDTNDDGDTNYDQHDVQL